MAENHRITVLTGPHRSTRLCLAKGKPCLIGRDRSCTLVLSGHPRDGVVSRLHCLLEIEGSCLRVRDLRSSNGTYVNGRRVEGSVILHDGDLLTVGSTTLRVEKVDCPVALGGASCRGGEHGCLA